MGLLPQRSERLTPYFPHADAISTDSFPTSQNLDKSEEIAPIFDTEHIDIPLADYEASHHADSYGDGVTEVASSTPARPSAYEGRYLLPTLTQNERLRLTMLWYHAKHALDNNSLLDKLQSIVEMVKRFIGWEAAVVGFVDEAVYNRLATADLPVNIIPRRESMCAHTIHQKDGSVFMVPSLLDDWRFESAPHVVHAGLRAYAGTPLTVKLENGDSVALGSLCVTSTTRQKPLTPDQKASLIRFADMMVSEIVASTRQARLRDRQRMSDALMALQHTTDCDNYELSISDALRRVYPRDIFISIQSCHDNMVQVENRPAFNIDEVSNLLWEDSELVEATIRNENFQHLRSTQSIRAVVVRCGRSPQLLVVASSDFHHIFDDYDAWFVEHCALALAEVIHERELQAARSIKDTFMRGITHQLRTPIHGVLASADLLAEELSRIPSPLPASGAKAGTPGSAYLAAIRNSGRELMSTVNNVLKLNNWADSGFIRFKTSLYDMSNLESDMLEEVFLMVPEEQLYEISLIFDNQLSSERCCIDTNLALLKECVQSLVLNAVQACHNGSITVTTSALNDGEGVVIDVVDTGIGIRPEDQDRIFQAYEKVDQHCPGVGLGLTLACKIAQSLKGNLTLEGSTLTEGSHFRLQLNTPLVVNPSVHHTNGSMDKLCLPATFSIAREPNSSHMLNRLATQLDVHGLNRTEQRAASLVIADVSCLISPWATTTCSDAALVMCICPSADFSQVQQLDLALKRKVLPVTGPFYASRLEEILMEASSFYRNLRAPEPIQGQSLTLPFRSEDRRISTATTTAVRQTTTSSASMPPRHQSEPLVTIPKKSPGLSIKRALLVDDNAINLRILRMYCEKRNIRFLLATDGNEAVAQYKSALSSDRPVDLVFMDLQMPHCDGLTATKEIRRFETEQNLSKPSTMFIITGQDTTRDRDDCFLAGADHYLVKPVAVKILDRDLAKYF